jgi:APA family basic amino acid/polyamine antiporter
MDTPDSRKLSLLDSTTIIMGSMIGSGVFIVAADIARKVESPGLFLLTWIVTAVITVLGALSYGELAAMFPKAGGQYVYLREAYNPLFGFLYGWTLFAVIQTGTIAAVGVAFAKFTGVFWPFISGDRYLFSAGSFHISTQQILALAVIVFLTVYNYREVKSGARLQNIFTLTKALALLVLVAFGIWFGMHGSGSGAHLSPLLPETFSWKSLGIFGSALTGSLFAADAWNSITFTAGEVKHPHRNIPLSLLIGTGVVLALYLLANFAYLYVLGIGGVAGAENDRVGTSLMQAVMGDGGKFVMAALIMVSTFGCLNGIIFTAARVYYAMAKDGLFFRPAATLNRNHVPAKSLTMQCIWSCLLCFSGSYSDLLDYVMFAVMVFYVLTVSGLFILRYKRPDAERPYRTWGYPVLPAVYVLLALAVSVFMILNNGQNCLWGAVIMLAGVPVYYLFKRRAGAQGGN